MANEITPMVTNLAASGKLAQISASVEFDMGEHDTGRMPLVEFATENMAYDQMIPFQVDVEAGQVDYNIWEAPSEGLRARAVIATCLYGAGALKINSGSTPTGFPLAADDTAGNGWMIYNNPSGNGPTIGATPTGPGIQDIKVDTENESRFLVFVFI